MYDINKTIYIIMSQKKTLISHIFNEEYLLPFWLEHHKNLFDDIIIIDYRSTDKSIEICKKICPECKIITTRNPNFNAELVDKEVMDLENDILGIKMVLNTTEFLYCESSNSINDLFNNMNQPKSYSVTSYSPYSKNNYHVNNTNELIVNLLNEDVVFHTDRGVRQIHNFPNGNYTLGRHKTHNHTIPTDKLNMIWFGFYPMNENLLKRKLQISQNIPQSDKDRNNGIQHLYDKEKIMSINNEKVITGSKLENLNIKLYNLIQKYTMKYVYYPELLEDNNNNHGDDYVMINNDINLLQNTYFDNDGYKIIDMDNYNELLVRFITNEIFFITNKYINLNNYHNEINDEEHNKILNSMPYKKKKYQDIHDFCIYLETDISKIINEPVKIFNDDIWVRICRPSDICNYDFNPCHKDVYLDFYRNTINIYLPIIGSNENSSLKIQPGSHKWKESDTVSTIGGAFINNKKYSVDAIIASKTQIDMIRPNPNTSQFILFSPYLIHGCSDNYNENMTRISLEIRFIKNDRNRFIEQEYKFNQFLKSRKHR